MNDNQWLHITYAYTPEFAAEAVARAGGKGTAQESRDVTAASTATHRVNARRSLGHIGDMWTHGYRVVSVRIPFCQWPPRA